MKNTFWLKVVSYIIFSILLLVLILQNAQTVEFKFLIFSLEVPLVFLILVSSIIGFLLGILTIFFIYPRGEKQKQ